MTRDRHPSELQPSTEKHPQKTRSAENTIRRKHDPQKTQHHRSNETLKKPNLLTLVLRLL
jgi:hypothetical protein